MVELNLSGCIRLPLVKLCEAFKTRLERLMSGPIHITHSLIYKILYTIYFFHSKNENLMMRSPRLTLSLTSSRLNNTQPRLSKKPIQMAALKHLELFRVAPAIAQTLSSILVLSIKGLTHLGLTEHPQSKTSILPDLIEAGWMNKLKSFHWDMTSPESFKAPPTSTYLEDGPLYPLPSG